MDSQPFARSKTTATWLAFLAGPLGMHRFYLRGVGDAWGWLSWPATLLGAYGVVRARQLGLDDAWSWVLIPLLGLAIAAGALQAIYFGLMSPETWNSRFNRHRALDDPCGKTHWGTIFGIALALMVGTGVLMASLAFSFQRYFEYQIEAAKQISA